MPKTFQPFHDRVLVRRSEAVEKTEGGIFIPEKSKEHPCAGVVVAIGEKVACTKAGDSVLFGKYCGTEVSVGGESMLVMREEDIFGRVD
jgi:chaperonin GroES